MTKQHFKEQLSRILFDAQTKEENLRRQYAIANNPYNIGDIISDNIQIIRIDKIHVLVNMGSDRLPECIYYGTELEKDGTPKKYQSNYPVYQSNIKTN